jgi:dTDP-4-amino-4,6-dideoxygalactose transaminase
MNIPFVDLKQQYLSIKNDIDTGIQNVINNTSFVGGKYVKEFEEAFAKAYGVKHMISVANGTDSLYIIMKMLGVGEGDEVITVANSWISSSETITQAGAKPVFVDIHPDYYSIDET